MFKIVRAIRKILAAFLFWWGIIVIATGVYCYRYQHQIIQGLLDEANKWSSYPIQIRTVRLTLFKSFPSIALACHDVVVKERTGAATDLIAARKIYCAFDVWKLMQGQYLLTHLHVEHGQLHIGEDLGVSLSQGADVQKVAQREIPLIVGLHDIHLKDMELWCSGARQHFRIYADQMKANLKWEHAVLEADLRGKAVIQHIQFKDLSFAQNLPLSLKASLTYDQRQRTWTLRSTQLRHGNALLTLQGNGGLAAASPIFLTIQGKRVSPQFLLRCLPKQYDQKIKQYDPRGQVTFGCRIDKQPSQFCSLQGDFALHDGAITVSQLSAPIVLRLLSGRLNIPNIQDLKTATLRLDQLTGTAARSKLVGSIALRDFHNLYLQCVAKAKLELAVLGTLLAHPAVTDASGMLDLDGKLEANLKQLMRGHYERENFRISGALQTQAAQFKMGPAQVPCKDLMGKLIFKDDALIIQDCSGSIGPGGFMLAGTLHNLLPHLFLAKPKLWGDVQFCTDYLDLDALRYGRSGSVTPTNVRLTKFNIAPQWFLNFDCDIQQFHYRRFQGKNIRGRVKVKDQKLIAENLQLGFSGGKVFLDGAIDASTDDLNIHTVAKLQSVRLADLFYTFENFRQDFLMDSHLSGKVSSDVDLTVQADRRGNMRWETLNAVIDCRMIDGGLHNFDPIQQLAKYMDREHLTNLRFSELKNRILIKEKTIYIPPMEVHASPTRIQLSGMHTFDGKVAYTFGVPFAGLQEELGAPDDIDAAAGPHLFFKLAGHTGCYTINHDAAASRKNLAKALKGQGKVLRNLLQGTYRKNKQFQALALDDYFEFSE